VPERPLKAVAFDLWETLITQTRERSREQTDLRLANMEAVLARHGWTALADRIEHAHQALWDRCQELYWSADRDVPCRTQVEHFLEFMDVDPQTMGEPLLAELEHAYAHAALEILPDLVDGARETVETLKSQGLRIGLISNTGRTPGSVLRRILDALGLAPSIDTMVFSNEHGECKPQASIFEALRRGLGVAYEETAFVGDNLYVDVHGAQRCGMRGIHFVPPVRGAAIAPPVDHGLTIVPDAEITDLRELLRVL
jgi:putative hydrolase of the HAD superfamily